MAVILFSSWMCSNLDNYTQEQARDIILRIKMTARTCFQQSVDYYKDFKISNLLYLKKQNSQNICYLIDATEEGK